MNKQLLEIYSDYLISSFSHTTATGLSAVLDNKISHDKITRFLSASDYDSKALWLLVKNQVRAVENKEACIIFDDTIQEKAYTDENEIITWHFDHTKNRTIKGVNILNCLYSTDEADIPVAFEIIRKDIWFSDLKTRKTKRKSEVTKNELMRDMLRVCRKNQIKYKYVLADSWFSSKDNMSFIKLDLKKDFIMALKTNRIVALSMEDKKKGRFVKISSLRLRKNTAKTVYLKGLDFPVSLLKQVFTNKDGSSGILYLICSDENLSYDKITAIYQKRWNVEVFHKSIKSNACLAKSPTRTLRTQSNHFFASIYSFFKLEMLKIKHNLNHFALRAKIYIAAIKAGHKQLQKLNNA